MLCLPCTLVDQKVRAALGVLDTKQSFIPKSVDEYYTKRKNRLQTNKTPIEMHQRFLHTPKRINYTEGFSYQCLLGFKSKSIFISIFAASRPKIWPILQCFLDRYFKALSKCGNVCARLLFPFHFSTTNPSLKKDWVTSHPSKFIKSIKLQAVTNWELPLYVRNAFLVSLFFGGPLEKQWLIHQINGIIEENVLKTAKINWVLWAAICANLSIRQS